MERSEPALRKKDFRFLFSESESERTEESYVRRERNWGADLQRLVANPLFPRAGAAVLEIGCGTGVASLILAKLGYKVIGVDISKAAIKWAGERVSEAELSFGSAEFRVGRIDEMSGFVPGSFDAVISGCGFHGLLGDERRSFLGRVNEALRPGGVFFFNTRVGNPSGPLAAGVYDFRTRCQIIDGVPYRYFGQKDEILGELAQAGFSLLELSERKRPGDEQLFILAQTASRH